jgi:flagellar M-ring protein FliF
MKELLTTLWEGLKSTSAQTRLVIGAGILLTLAVTGIMSYRSANPHLVLSFSGLDNARFTAVTSALAAHGVRFDTSSPPAPFSVFVPENERYQARNAVAAAGALASDSKGIQTSAGAASIFDHSAKRLQENQKRDWQDLEQQLESLAYIDRAVVRTSGPPPSPLLRGVPPTVSVVLHVRGSIALDASQRRSLASIVRAGTNVPDKNITITDQNLVTLFDGSSDQSLDDQLRFEQEWADVWSTRAQNQLDVMFGPGMTTVNVSGEFDHTYMESVDEVLNPTAKLSESIVENTTPSDALAGGPAGVGAVLNGGNPPAPAAPPAPATEIEQETSYAHGRKTTHSQKSSPTLLRMSVSLVIHDSIKDRLADAEDLVKRLVRFDEERDLFSKAALPLVGVEVDDEGNPVPAAVIAPPEPPNRMLMLLLEHGIELLAAAAFLMVLLKSLKKGSAPRQQAAAATSKGPALIPDDELDLDMLARKHVEQMLEEDPEKVAALLSRWALGENFYAGAKS